MALRRSPYYAPPPSLQAHPQDPPRVFCSVWTCGRVRSPHRDPRPRARNGRRSSALVLGKRRKHAHCHDGAFRLGRRRGRELTRRACVQYVWITLRLCQAVDSHSGYDFPWSLNKFFPAWAGADVRSPSLRSLHTEPWLIRSSPRAASRLPPPMYVASVRRQASLLTLPHTPAAFSDCYATSFRYLDYLFGTDRKYHAFRDKQHAAKKALKTQ